MRYFWVFGNIDLKIKDANKKANSNIDLKIYDEKIDPGAVDFPSGFPRENSIRWVIKLLLGN